MTRNRQFFVKATLILGICILVCTSFASAKSINTGFTSVKINGNGYDSNKVASIYSGQNVEISLITGKWVEGYQINASDFSGYFELVNERRIGNTYTFDLKARKDKTGKTDIRFKLFDGSSPTPISQEKISFQIREPQEIKLRVVSPYSFNEKQGTLHFKAETNVPDDEMIARGFKFEWTVGGKTFGCNNAGHYCEAGYYDNSTLRVTDALSNEVVEVFNFGVEEVKETQFPSAKTGSRGYSGDHIPRIDFGNTSKIGYSDEPYILDLSRSDINQNEVIFVDIKGEYGRIVETRKIDSKNSNRLLPEFRFNVTGEKEARVRVCDRGGNVLKSGSFRFRINPMRTYPNVTKVPEEESLPGVFQKCWRLISQLFS